MSPGGMTLLGITILLLILSVGTVISNSLYRRKDRKIEKLNEETLDQAGADNERLANEYGQTLSTMVAFFFAYQKWRSTEKDSRERKDAQLELSALWDSLPADAQKALLELAEPVGLKIPE
jgi:hypothetical protein